MKKILLSLMLLSSLMGFSQNWTKAQRQGLYDLAKNNFVLNKGLSQEQQKAISLCFMETITKEFTFEEYHNKIDIELESINNSMIDRCAKKMGLSLNKKETKVEPKNEKLTINFSNVQGNWKDNEDGSTLYLESNSKYVVTDGDNIRKGKWRIEGSYLILTWLGKFAILELTSTSMTLNKGKEVSKFTKQ